MDSIPTDLGDLASVFRAVDSIRSVTQSIDVVFANAGISKASTPLSPDGLETVFAINHVGHYALITRILPILIQTASYPDADVRVVITSSSLAWYARRINFPSLHTPFEKEKGKLIDMYTRSKLADLLFGLKLADYVREQGSTNIFVNIGEPGIIFGTDVHRQMETTYTFWTRMWVAILKWLVGLSVQDGALTLLFLGTSPTIREEAINGRFYRPFGDLIPREKYPKWATDDLAEKLWDWSEEFVSKERDGAYYSFKCIITSLDRLNRIGYCYSIVLRS